MMEQTKLSLEFCGNTFVPLSSSCYGCYYFNYECEGSVYRKDCLSGQVEDMRDSLIANHILQDERVQNNRFLLARIAGFPLEEEHIATLQQKIDNSNKPEFIGALQEAIRHFRIAQETDEYVVDKIWDDYKNKVVEVASTQEEQVPQEATPMKQEKLIVYSDPFSSGTPIDISEDDLPF